MIRPTPGLLALAFLAVFSSRAELRVFAAASLTDAAREIAAAYETAGGESARFNFASSGALARQIDAGAPADVFISAHPRWMDWLIERDVVEADSRFVLAGNALVLVAPTGSSLAFGDVPKGRVAVGDLKGVPAGIYAKEALEHLGWMEAWRPRFVQCSNVRTALLYVQRGEVDAGIVYATDARAANLPVVDTFPADSHAPITYPVAACNEKDSASRFLAFLRSETSQTILARHGFLVTDD